MTLLDYRLNERWALHFNPGVRARDVRAGELNLVGLLDYGVGASFVGPGSPLRLIFEAAGEVPIIDPDELHDGAVTQGTVGVWYLMAERLNLMGRVRVHHERTREESDQREDVVGVSLAVGIEILPVYTRREPELTVDSDGDSLADSMDDCPMLAEDFDDFEDAKGCPETPRGGVSVTRTG